MDSTYRDETPEFFQPTRNIPRVHEQNVFQTMWIGATAGMGGIIAVYPIDVIKTRMQNTVKTTSAMNTLTTILRNEGFRSFYKGLGPQLCGTIPDKAVSLATRDFVKSFFDKPHEFQASLISAATSGIMQSIVMNPVEVIKVRLQLESTLKPFQVIQELGIQGLYKGYTACLARDVMFASTYFTLYDMAKTKMGVHDNSSLVSSMIAASTAGIPAAFFSTPLDLIKTRMQSRNAPIQGFRNTLQHVLAQGGVRALFAGWGPRVSRIAPQFGIVLVSFDWLSHRFNPNVNVPEPADTDAYADY
ncbi:ef-hand domain-containing protein [Plasmopara halstedii]|uniref:Ef-hand domain-containing protein n=1 Tax=Plasmopara halstedii TaxID=4781 RepID=A0A0N7L5M1_PLAHL|nr:ef-hand domain-containing protein [Plasmopara halstedii]CEG41859.1 ef-hand domain-containing protein [Plasmopara halstedii]|eukprot:XP_024578228.1 ef-hand domain-containing protein [Plasmopara halstedii]